MTLAAIVTGVWLLLAWLQIFAVLDLSNTGSIGQGAIGGILGLLVMTVALVFLFVLFGELGETAPGPERWPPSE